MSKIMEELLGSPEPEVPDEQREQPLDIVMDRVESKHDVKRIRFGQFSGRLLLSLNGPAARDLMSTPAFWYHMDAMKQTPIFLRPDEMAPGYFSEAQAVLVPQRIEGSDDEHGPELTDEQIREFARMCVDGKIVRRWAVPEAEAAQRGVIVCDNRRVLPDNQYDVGPGNSDVIAASVAHYAPRNRAVAA